MVDLLGHKIIDKFVKIRGLIFFVNDVLMNTKPLYSVYFFRG
ncbi:hypothetical protein JBKA6_0872 [Ichthyobacterium seriolicida]|uniref:Uncharacterized protein n=1 Tax=Ichthyobacterium seriolicida TaxID=242600 RepID=A0A1J1E1Q8_9FLAO|nr:hypothetical protein JBKA6_0872 [Ichthyobacterium seriolicida]